MAKLFIKPHNTIDIVATAGAVAIRALDGKTIAVTPALASLLGDELKHYAKIADILVVEDQENG